MDISLIDPVLLLGEGSDGETATNGAIITPHPQLITPTASASNTVPDAPTLDPRRDPHSIESEEEYRSRLESEKRKAPLAAACSRLGIKTTKSANLPRLRGDLVNYWCLRGGVPMPPAFNRPAASSTTQNLVSGSNSTGPSTSSAPPTTVGRPGTARQPPARSSAPEAIAPRLATASLSDEEADSDDEAALVRAYASKGADAEEILGYDNEGDDDEESVDGDDGSDVDASEEEVAHDAFKRSVRVAAVRRAEGNRRAGGIKTQKAMVKSWNDFKVIALQKGNIKDGVVDEHSLLLFIKYNAEREKLSRRGVPIPGTRLGASQLKKLFFGALRIRKEQDAGNKTLTQTRPATTFIVWEAIKNRMDEALERVRNGLDETDDAPDIRANTFLSEVTEEQLQRIGYGFLAHRQLRLVIFGHLAWACQHATGNRGDDFRALKLAELQPYDIQHPNRRTIIPSVLGLQGEEKAGKRGMRTVVNPSYSAFIANKNPEMCPLGAFAFYHHYIHDEKKISDMLSIDWSVNKSWRQIRILHGPKSPNTPYNEQNLYNLYSRAYASAGFSSRMKAHLPRHLLGYRQEEKNVDGAETSKLGWTRGQTYFDTYAPALPKKAILGAAGYQAEEDYDPIWQHVHVPQQFLELICPKAEEIHASIATNYWLMVIQLRPYAFQCGAAIFQKCPKSALFRLPAFTNTDVRNWMTTTFPTELALLQASAGSPVDLALVQNEVLRQSLADLYRICQTQAASLAKLHETIERRTAVLSPAKGFSTSTYHRNGNILRPDSAPPLRQSHRPSVESPTTPPIIVHLDRNMEETGTYHTGDTTDSMRAFVNSSPKSPDSERATTQVDLVLPPPEAFYTKDSERGVFPPLFGQKSVRWPDVFALIEHPKFCWAVWGPTRSVNKFIDVNEFWSTYVDGEAVYNDSGVQTGMKPPLRLVESYFQSTWRTPDDPRERAAVAKHWERYREIPQWIAASSERRAVAPPVIIAELEAMRLVDGKPLKGLNWLRGEVEKKRKEAKIMWLTRTPGTISTVVGDRRTAG
ncbi:hypothetical protein DFH09DRAFT_1434967 [Mycena vulgaris]|nr:hypothetical protein DFH09DRAFT_1434967 [Mycena vulgaris]